MVSAWVPTMAVVAAAICLQKGRRHLPTAAQCAAQIRQGLSTQPELAGHHLTLCRDEARELCQFASLPFRLPTRFGAVVFDETVCFPSLHTIAVQRFNGLLQDSLV